MATFALAATIVPVFIGRSSADGGGKDAAIRFELRETAFLNSSSKSTLARCPLVRTLFALLRRLGEPGIPLKGAPQQVHRLVERSNV